MTSRARVKLKQAERWYSARLLIEMTIDGLNPPQRLFEESVIIFKMPDNAKTNAIRRRVGQLGNKASHHYKNQDGETVRWTFQEVLEVQEILGDELSDGTEVYYRWWDNPSDRKLQMIRETHEEAWWT